MLERHVESKKIPGLVALVGRGEETHLEAIGTMRHDGGTPMRGDTIFRMASTTKPVAVAATMVLLDECRLRLDDPIDQWLPEPAGRRVLERADGPLDETVPARRPITVRDLLTSTCGLGLDMTATGSPMMGAYFEQRVYGENGWMLPAVEPDEWMRRLGALPLMYQPGERWLYNVGDAVLGVLVARVTGQSFEAFLRERIFGPLGMKDTGFHVPADKIDRLPPLYTPDPQTGEFTVEDPAAGWLGLRDDGAHLPRRLRAHRPIRLGRRSRHHDVRRPAQPTRRHPAHPDRDVHPGLGTGHARLLDHPLPGHRRLTCLSGQGRSSFGCERDPTDRR
ncbi:serine hydrolase [Streptomyces mashuensis]|uniref:Serine hydrolase n=1 Tax=Streptomyces mashuensis TaxID=33904 RepID=A0A919B8Z3_9ACTN|nr:serine hydrolase domain-containing protein [Streptomyces mashuensis]GHF65691.1 serine hydrolase [Streptomyces mashuensis]